MNKSFYIALLSLALTAPQSLWADGSGLAYQQYVLANGLIVVLHEDHSFPVCAQDVLYRVGSKNEDLGRTGFAHLFEHLNFRGSDHVPGDEFKNRIPGCGGYANADTTPDRTNYYATIPCECLEDVLRMDADRMGFLKVDQESFENQRGVVKEEKKLNHDNSPYGRAWGELHDLVWDQGHPYKWDTIGSMRDLDAATLQDVQRFHSRYYNPNNAVLVIAGDITPDTVLPMVQRHFGTLRKGPTPPALSVPPAPPLSARRERTVTDDKARLSKIFIAYRVPPNGPEARALEVIASVLGDGRTSRLIDAIQYREQLALSIEVGLYGLRETDLFVIEAQPMPGVPPGRLAAAIDKELARIVQDGITEREMKQVKAGLKNERLNALQRMDEIAQSMAEGKAFEKTPDAFGAHLDQIEAMPLTAPQAAAQKYLNPHNAAVLTVNPKQAQGDRP